MSDYKSFKIFKDEKEAKIQIFIVVEIFRVLAWIWFLLLMLIGMILTVAFTQEDYKAIMGGVFGSVNSCVYLDFFPATYVAPIIYSFFPILVFLYCVASIFRAWISMNENKINYPTFIFYTAIFVYFFLTTLVFSICLSIQPDPNDPKTIQVHSFPFTNLILANMLLQVMVAWFNQKVAWINTDFFKWMIVTNFIGLLITIIASTLKIVQHLNSILFIEETLKMDENGQILSNGFIWDVHSHETLNSIFQMTDVVWLFSAVILPILQGGYLIHRRHDTHGLIITIEDNRAGKDDYDPIE